MDGHRYYKNPYPDYDPSLGVNEQELLSNVSENILNNIRSMFQNWEQNVQYSRGDSTVYTGPLGDALLYMKLYEDKIFLEKQNEFLNKIITILTKYSHYNPKYLAFLTGYTATLTIQALIYHSMKNDYKNPIMELCELIPKILEDGIPDEILYGRSGFLYSLLLIRSRIPDSKQILTDDLIRKVIEKILRSGELTARKEKSNIPLVYYWHDTAYVGAAHGYAGILYMLLEAHEFLTQNEMESLVKPTIDFVYSLKFNHTGNYCSSLGHKDDKLLHWCHGSPGVIHMLVLAYKHFKDTKYLDAAKQACDDIWKRGLLKKGCGLCHGVAGNGYAFTRMYQLTNDVKYLYRAIKFAEWCFEYEQHRTRIPDRPYSLFEGLAGTIYFLIDILNPRNCKFPAFQIE